LNELALFAGAGGGILGGKLLGWRTVCAVEIEPYPRSVLLQRQDDGILDPFPVWDDIRTFDGKPWRGKVDIVTGGFPCTDVAVCRRDAKGIEGESSGLWSEQRRIIREVRPIFAYVENSPALTIRGLDRVLGELAEMGYNAEWGVLGSCHTGGDSRRFRIWIAAYSNSDRLERWHNCGEKRPRNRSDGSMAGLCENQVWDDIPTPDAFGTANGVAYRMERLKAIGNGQIPIVAAKAWQILTEGID